MLSLYSVFQTCFYLPSHLLSDLSLSVRKRCLLQPGKPLPSPASRQAPSSPASVSFSSLAIHWATQTRINPDCGWTTSFLHPSPGFLPKPCLGTHQVCGTGLGAIPVTVQQGTTTSRHHRGFTPAAGLPLPLSMPQLTPQLQESNTVRQAWRRGKWKTRQELTTTGEKQPPPPHFRQHLNKKMRLQWHSRQKPDFTLKISFG